MNISNYILDILTIVLTEAGYDSAYINTKHPRTYYLVKGHEEIKVIGRRNFLMAIGWIKRN